MSALSDLMRAHREGGRAMAERQWLQFADLAPITDAEVETLTKHVSVTLTKAVRELHLGMGIDRPDLDEMMLRHAVDGFAIRTGQLRKATPQTEGGHA